MLDTVTDILGKCNTPNTNINPTILYNEGWMSRILVSLSISHKVQVLDINFGRVAHWYSEGLLSSPFMARYRGDKLAEGFTHADIAIGDFKVDVFKRGDVKLKNDAELFGVIEAKMGSKLSSGTTNAENYNQASRNLACIAFNSLEKTHELFFAVVAPDKKIQEHDIQRIVNHEFMLFQISERFESYEKTSDIYALKSKVLKRANDCKCAVISYESWIDKFPNNKIRKHLTEFLQCCYKCNKIG